MAKPDRSFYFRNRHTKYRGRFKLVIELLLFGGYQGDLERVELMDKAMDFLVLRQFSRDYFAQKKQKMLEDKSSKYELRIDPELKFTKPYSWEEIKYEYEGGEVLWKEDKDIFRYSIYLRMWDDINEILAWVTKHVRVLPIEMAEQFREYLVEDTNDYPNKRELMQQIKEIFIFLEEIKLYEEVRKEVVKPPTTPAKEAIILNTAIALPTYSDIEPQRFLLNPHYLPQGIMTAVAFKAYQQYELPERIQELFRDFLMRNYWDVFVKILPHSIKSSIKHFIIQLINSF